MTKRRHVRKEERVTKEVVKGGAYKPGDRKKRGPRKLPRETIMKRKKSPGRPKGSPNRFPGLLKDALIEAAEYAGRRLPPPKKRGEAVSDLVAYLSHQALHSPNAFMALLGRVMPLQIQHEGDGPLLIVDKVEYHVVDGRDKSGQELDSAEHSPRTLAIEGTAEVVAVDPPGEVQGRSRG